MNLLPTIWLAAAALAVGAAGGAALAAKLSAAKTAQAEERRARCEQSRAETARAAAEATARALARAQDAEAAAASRMAAQQAAFQNRLKEARSEIYNLATGRECLSGALRLRLNAALGAADNLPAPAGAALDANAGAAADPALPSPGGRGARGEGTTDADLAGWILDAASRYEDCRARIDALRKWDEMTFDGR